MPQVPTGSVALVVTSPPYFAGKQYELSLGVDGVPATYFEYLQLLRDVFAECKRVLEPGGRIAVNVANLGRRPYRSLSGDVTTILQDLGLLLRGEVIWWKGRAAGGSCAWGIVPASGEPGAARHHRARRDRQQGALRPRPDAGAAGRPGPPVDGDDHARRVHGGDDRPLGDRAGERQPRRAPRAVPRRAAAAAHRAVHLRRRRRARPVHGLGQRGRRRGAHRPALHRLRHRRRVHRHCRAADHGGTRPATSSLRRSTLAGDDVVDQAVRAGTAGEGGRPAPRRGLRIQRRPHRRHAARPRPHARPRRHRSHRP